MPEPPHRRHRPGGPSTTAASWTTVCASRRVNVWPPSRSTSGRTTPRSRSTRTSAPQRQASTQPEPATADLVCQLCLCVRVNISPNPLAVRYRQEINQATPPRTWGQQSLIRRYRLHHRSTPTPVGTTYVGSLRRSTGSVHPHTRGDNLTFSTPSGPASGPPPHAWGQHCPSDHATTDLSCDLYRTSNNPT